MFAVCRGFDNNFRLVDSIAAFLFQYSALRTAHYLKCYTNWKVNCKKKRNFSMINFWLKRSADNRNDGKTWKESHFEYFGIKLVYWTLRFQLETRHLRRRHYEIDKLFIFVNSLMSTVYFGQLCISLKIDNGYQFDNRIDRKL